MILIETLKCVLPFLRFLLVREMSYYHHVGQRHLMDTHLDVSRKSGEFVKVDLSGLVCVLTTCEDIHHTLKKYTGKLTKRLIRSFTVSRSKAANCHE